jgi:DNA-binding NarL/FixJ family response regulator
MDDSGRDVRPLPWVCLMSDLEAVVELARADYDAGQYESAVRTLDVLIARGGPVLGDASLLRARVAIRCGQPMKAVTVLGDARAEMTPVQLVEADMHLMVAHAFSGDHASAAIYAASLDDIDVKISSALRVEIDHARASAAWARNDMLSVEKELKRCGDHLDLRSHARHLQLTAALAGRREQYARQATILCEALDVIERDSQQELALAATLLRSLCIALREIVAPDHQIDRATALYKRFPWTEELCADRVVSALHLAWIRALAGDQLGALRYVQDAYAKSIGGAWQVAALADRAAIKAAMGETGSSLLDLEEGLYLAEQINWAETADEERLFLITLAELAAPVNPARAQALLLRSNILARGGNMRLAYHQNRRIQAMAYHAQGVIAHQIGDEKVARASLRLAYETFVELSCSSRAAEAALVMHKVTRDDVWLRNANEAARLFPRSWIAAAARAAVGSEKDDAYARLTPRQREVFKALLDGLTASEISQRVGGRPNTIRNHMQCVYNSFGVTSQAQLLAEARRRKLA